MKNRKIVVLLLTFSMLFSLVGCGSKTKNENVEATEKIEKEVANTESVDSTEEAKVVVPTSTYDGLTFIEPASFAEYSFDVDKFDEDIDVSFVTPKDLSLYSSEGIKVAEVKKDVTLHAIASSSKYAWVALENPVENTPYDKLYLLVDDDVDVAMTSNETSEKEETKVAETNSNTTTKETTKKDTTSKKNESANTNNNTSNNNNSNTAKQEQPTNSEPKVEETQPQEQPTTSNKYTPEEAIAYYRSQVEAQGMQWNPSIKEFASWGSGWIPLSKDELNSSWIANEMAGFNYGSGDGTPFRNYYIEVTGSDEDNVYITAWTCE